MDRRIDFHKLVDPTQRAAAQAAFDVGCSVTALYDDETGTEAIALCAVGDKHSERPSRYALPVCRAHSYLRPPEDAAQAGARECESLAYWRRNSPNFV